LNQCRNEVDEPAPRQHSCVVQIPAFPEDPRFVILGRIKITVPPSILDAPPTIHQAVAVIGVEPLIQYLTPSPGGRLQVFNPACDPAHKDWFAVFSGEDRQPHEWGFWKNQGMKWNSQCAACHMTSFEKNYDPILDAYASA